MEATSTLIRVCSRRSELSRGFLSFLQGRTSHDTAILRVNSSRLFSGTRECSVFFDAEHGGGQAKKKKKLMPLQERKMIDKFRLHVRGGAGGAGCTSFRKGRQSRHGFADGGNGGRGGDVILVGSSTVWDMSNLQHHLNGTSGGPGSSKKKIGSRGSDKIVQVPVGTVIHLVRGQMPFLGLDQNARPRENPSSEAWEVEANPSSTWDHSQYLALEKGSSPSAESVSDHVPGATGNTSRACDSYTDMREEESDEEFEEDDEEDEDRDSDQDIQTSVAEFIKAGQSFIVAGGGDGGKGNASMARGRGAEKSLPSLDHEPGRAGSEADLILELKTIADVGLVGAPNAGKSTLLGSLSRAKPVSGHYKFTTLRPNIGMLEFDDYFSLTVADIPGLIEGAHQNRGLGHAFLRHIERTKALAYVIDLAGGTGDDTGPLPWDQYLELVFELEQYQSGLSKRPSIIVANKIDEEGAEEALKILREKVPVSEIFPVCAVLDEGVEDLKLGIRKLIESSSADYQSVPLSRPREL